jgi:WD40 repeat protein
MIGPLGGQLWCGVFSPEPKLLAISQGYPESVHIYDIAKEQSISRVEIPTWMHSMASKPDGSLIAGGLENGSVLLWDPWTRIEKGRWCLGLENPLLQSFATISGVQFIDGGGSCYGRYSRERWRWNLKV